MATALEKDRDRRYQTAQDFADDLRRVRSFEPIHAKPAGPLLRLLRWSERNRGLAVSLAALFLSLGAGLVLSESLRDELRNQRDQIRSQLELITLVADPLFLREREERLWDQYPNNLVDLDEWLANADRMLNELQMHRYQRVREKWKGDMLVRLAEEVKRRFLGSWGLVHRVRAAAERVRTVMSPRDGWANLWNKAIGSIAENPTYRGLRLGPQAGLVPIGPDPVSGLWEFAHLLTGEVPLRDADTGKICPTGETGIVFVLLPGDEYWMGAERFRRESPNCDENAEPQESPVHRRKVSPFLLSKYEMTQGQWLRLTGTNPSYSKTARGVVPPDDLLCSPMEMVSWQDCDSVCTRISLRLPTETEWEYACRATTTTPTHGDRRSVAWFSGNAQNQSHPVGSKDPNAFGLHDMLGNVWEMCFDWYDDQEYERRSRSNTVTDAQGPAYGVTRVERGGSFESGPALCRAFMRRGHDPSNRSFNRGFRLAKDL
jgi:formylglycine-generating enzyme required for sulfatase activity